MAIIPRIFKPGSFDPSRGTGSGTMSELPPSYNARYPHNNVLASTQSGHLIEVDDTPGAERIHIYHRTGSHVEMRPDGSVKYKTVKTRQDVTIGDHEVIIQGDYRITTDGGMQLHVRNGKLIIEGGSGIEVYASGGDISMQAPKGNIKLEAKKISLDSLYVDIGKAASPAMSFPSCVNSLFGVSFPTTRFKLPSYAGFGLPGVVAEIAAFVKRYKSSADAMAHLKTLKDANGEPQIPEIDEPEEIPLSSPGLYRDSSPAAVRFRDRQLDTPEDVENTETYSAHLSTAAEIGDYDAYPDAKKVPGQVFASDEEDPAPAPLPYRSFQVGVGTVSCQLDSPLVIGTNTKFTEEVVVGQSILVAGQVVTVGSIANDTSLVLQTNWPAPSVSEKTLFAPQFRPFREFFNRYNYTKDTPLGDSGLTLRHFVVNFIPPVIDKSTTPIYREATSGGGAYEPDTSGNIPSHRKPDSTGGTNPNNNSNTRSPEAQ